MNAESGDTSLRGAVGILANPRAGGDVRRLAARASSSTLESKRNQVTRAAVGARRLEAGAGGLGLLLGAMGGGALLGARCLRSTTSRIRHLHL